MPTFYVTGVDEAGRSRVVGQRKYDVKSDYFEVHRFSEPVARLADGSLSSAPLLDMPTVPGGSVYNIYPWRAHERTPMHRTLSIDIDAVLVGSITLHLDVESIEMQAGDSVIVHGGAHAWEAGPQGAVMFYNLVAAEPTGSDIGRTGRPLLS